MIIPDQTPLFNYWVLTSSLSRLVFTGVLLLHQHRTATRPRMLLCYCCINTALPLVPVCCCVTVALTPHCHSAPYVVVLLLHQHRTATRPRMLLCYCYTNTALPLGPVCCCVTVTPTPHCHSAPYVVVLLLH